MIWVVLILLWTDYNCYGLSIYATGYTEEGEVDFDYIIVNNGAKTNYIELTINSNYSINKNL